MSRATGPPRRGHSHPSRARTRGAHSLSACCWPGGPGGAQRGLVAEYAVAWIGTGGARRAARVTVVVVAGTAFQNARTPLFLLRLSPQPGVLQRSRQEPVPKAVRLWEPSGRKFQLSAGRVRELCVRGSDGRGAGAVMRHLQSTLVFSSHAKGTLLPVPTLEVPCLGESFGVGVGS